MMRNITLSACIVALLTMAPAQTVGPPEYVGVSQTVTWGAPATNEDGSAITDLGGFIIAIAEESVAMNQPGAIALKRIRIEDPAARSWSGESLTAGLANDSRYSFWIAAFDKANNLSRWFGPITKQLDAIAPSPPADLRVVTVTVQISG